MSYDISCPSGELLSAVTFSAGSGLQKISNIYCKPPNRISDTSYGGDNQYFSNIGGSEGNPYTWTCPAGTAIGDIRTSYDGKYIRTFAPTCVNLQTNASAGSYTYGNNGTEVQSAGNANCGSKKFVTGM